MPTGDGASPLQESNKADQAQPKVIVNDVLSSAETDDNPDANLGENKTQNGQRNLSDIVCPDNE